MSGMTPKQHRLRRIWKVKDPSDRLRFGSAAARAEVRQRLTSTGEACDAMKIAHTITLFLDNSAAHQQFFQRYIHGGRNIINP
jgi:hypothetical protein